jgi:flagellar biosynthesis regulator FlbT
MRKVEEKKTDDTLTKLAESDVNQHAQAAQPDRKDYFHCAMTAAASAVSIYSVKRA